MKKDDIKFLIGSLVGVTFRADRYLSVELCDELIASGAINSQQQWNDYTSERFESIMRDMNQYTSEEFNAFIVDLLDYTKNNFDDENKFFLPYKIFSYLSVCQYKFFKKFLNRKLIHILQDFGREMSECPSQEILRVWGVGFSRQIANWDLA